MTKVTRVNMIEFNSEAEMKEQQSWFQANGPSLFPECILLTSVQTGPISVMSISVYPDQETADASLETREKLMSTTRFKDQFNLEGEVQRLQINKRIY